MKHICIDARMYGLRHAGIGRYIKNLVDRLVQDASEFTYHIILNREVINTIKFEGQVKTYPAASRHYSLSEQFEIPKIIKSINPDLVHFPHFNVPIRLSYPFVVTIHDILWHQIKGPSVTTLTPLKYAIKYQGYRVTVSKAIKNAHAIIVPSHWVKKQLTSQFPGRDSNSIYVTYEGVDDALTTSKSSHLDVKLPPIDTPYFIYTGSAYPHKNLELLLYALKSYNQIAQSKASLMIISARNVFLDQVKAKVIDLGLEKQVVFAGYIKDAAMRQAYSKATALIHPSLSEGFGLTGLEAMAMGLPILSSNASALPEVYAKAALFFDPHDVHSLTRAIDQIISDPSLSHQLVTAGYARSKEFSWDKTTQQTLAVYQQVFGQ